MKDVRDAVAQMIIFDECPFRQVNKLGFRRLMSLASLRFQMPSRTTIACDYYLMYKNERDRLKDFLKTC